MFNKRQLPKLVGGKAARVYMPAAVEVRAEQ